MRLKETIRSQWMRAARRPGATPVGPEKPAAAASASVADPYSRKFCPSCSEMMLPLDARCDRCGYDITTA